MLEEVSSKIQYLSVEKEVRGKGGVNLNLALFSQFTLANCRMCCARNKMGLRLR